MINKESRTKKVTCPELHILKVTGLGFEPRGPGLLSPFSKECNKVSFSNFSHKETETQIVVQHPTVRVGWNHNFKFFVLNHILNLWNSRILKKY